MIRMHETHLSSKSNELTPGMDLCMNMFFPKFNFFSCRFLYPHIERSRKNKDSKQPSPVSSEKPSVPSLRLYMGNAPLTEAVVLSNDQRPWITGGRSSL